MRPSIVFSIALLCGDLSAPLWSFAKKDPLEHTAIDILAEGRKLYRIERASWVGTDVAFEHRPGLRDSVRSSISYPDGEQTVFVFISRFDTTQAIITLRSDFEFTRKALSIDHSLRPLSPRERALYFLREEAESAGHADTSVKRYENVQYNAVPIIDEKGPRVYFLSGTPVNGVWLLGNDHLFPFTNGNKLKKHTALHRTLIQMEVTGDSTEGAIHTHLPGYSPYITPTDVCTIMLYHHIYNVGKSHVVVSEEAVSLFSSEGNGSLVIMTRKAFERMSRDIDQRRAAKQ